jgi:ATP-dependent DNA ligase
MFYEFSLLTKAGVDLRPLPLRERNAKLAADRRYGAEDWIALADGVVGEGRAL